MNGETDLNKLLKLISPKMLPGNYVFCTVQGSYGDYAELSPLGSYKETEGMTLILSEENAIRANIPFESVFKAITLTVHSSLDAVGLTAMVSTKLAAKGISANIVAAYYHDHIFVQADKAQLAIDALNEFQC